MTEEHIALALNICKILGTTLSGAFGLLGLVTEYRDSITKKITKAGKLALVGIIASTAVALISQSLESAKETRDAKKSAKAAADQIERSDSILREVDRTIEPLTDVTVSAWVTVPIDDPAMAAYKQRLLQGVEQIVQNNREHHPDLRLGQPARIKADGTVEEVRITVDSSLFPKQSETIPYYVLDFSGLHLQFFKQVQPRDAFEATEPGKILRPDLEMQISSMGPLEMSTSYTLLYDLVKHQLQIAPFKLASDSKQWHSNGKIVSIFDLSQTQLAVVIDNTMGPAPSQNGTPSQAAVEISRLRSKMILGSVIFQVKDRNFWLNTARLPHSPAGMILQRVERVSPLGTPETLYVGTLPADLETLER